MEIKQHSCPQLHSETEAINEINETNKLKLFIKYLSSVTCYSLNTRRCILLHRSGGFSSPLIAIKVCNMCISDV